MRKNLSVYMSAIGLLICFASNAQEITKGLPGMYPTTVDFKNTAPKFEKSIVLVDEHGKTIGTENATLTRFDNDELGFTHYRYQQVFLGIPVEHSSYILHTKDGLIQSQNGKWVKDFPSHLKTTASFTEATALQTALNEIGANSYKWQVATDEIFIKQEQNNVHATYFPKGELVFYSNENDIVPSEIKLAYKFDIFAAYPASRTIIFVDANDASILGKRQMIHSANTPGTAVTAYSGIQTITTDKINATSYRLRETGRGLGIETFNMTGAGVNYAAATDFLDTDNNWNNANEAKDHYATDAHWGAEKTYDYFFTRHHRNSVNNAGLILKSYVHTNLKAQGYPDNVNAFWDGTKMSYGDGDSNSFYKPLTSLDIAGHEIAHAVTQFSSNLTYNGESGAMNESFSDIFGTAIEFYARPNTANWTIGEDIGVPFRSMSNPNQYRQPDTYKGTYWYTGAGDNGGVHTNSGVLNYWFYLLSIGGSGTNDKGTSYNVRGVNIDKAGAIAYRLNNVYLISTSNYADAREKGIRAAEDLFGIGSEEAIQTANAWTAVGVYGNGVLPACIDIYEANETKTTSKTITSNTNITAKIGSVTDKDWFKFTTTAAAPKVQISLANLPADYDVTLYNSEGVALASSALAGTSVETIKYNSSSAAATYYIQVVGYNGATNENCYTLRAATSSLNFINSATSNTKAPFKEIKVEEKIVPFAVYPNPASNEIYINVAKTNIAYYITNALGQKIISGVHKLNTPINIGALSKGIYFIKIEEVVYKFLKE
jgi:bacillolysin